jgi:disulfide bond formation protein DsbB
MRVLKCPWGKRATVAAAMAVAALLAGGCDGGGDAAVSRDLAGAHGVPPDLAAASAGEGPGDAVGDGDLALELDDGRQLYLGTCAACHGTGGQGMPNQGPDLRGSAFLAKSTDDQLLAFLASGRPAGDPQNKSGLPMPPRGGNPSLSDRHLGQIVKYVRTVTAHDDVAQIGSAGDWEGRP